MGDGKNKRRKLESTWEKSFLEVVMELTLHVGKQYFVENAVLLTNDYNNKACLIIIIPTPNLMILKLISIKKYL